MSCKLDYDVKENKITSVIGLLHQYCGDAFDLFDQDDKDESLGPDEFGPDTLDDDDTAGAPADGATSAPADNAADASPKRRPQRERRGVDRYAYCVQAAWVPSDFHSAEDALTVCLLDLDLTPLFDD